MNFVGAAVRKLEGLCVEEWEQEARKKNDCVSEARLLAKYKGLVFVDPDTGKTCSVYDKNMEFCRGSVVFGVAGGILYLKRFREVGCGMDGEVEGPYVTFY